MRKGNLLLILQCICTVALGQKYTLEKVPSWVSKVPVPSRSTVTKYSIAEGYYLSLQDFQFNLDLDASYIHTVTQVVSYSGITKASQLAVTYDTSYQLLMIHYLYVWRNGVKIDRTSQLNFKKLNNEFSLNEGIYMGHITAYCNLDDIRKDDQIEFAYTLLGENPIFNGEKYIFMPLESTNPIDVYNIKILYDINKNYRYNVFRCDSSPIRESIVDNRFRQLQILQSNVPALNIDEDVPSWVVPCRYFMLSSVNSWSQVNSWAQQVFALKKEPDLSAVLSELFKGNETTDEKIDKLINYVQDDIRYMGVELGISSIKPQPPDKVVTQRFGDCKDKSLLLVSLLKKIGIDKAYPVLVHTVIKHNLRTFFPSNQVFNHCIVMFEHNNHTYWIDPTFTQQGGTYTRMSVMNYGDVLVVGKSSDTLTDMSGANYISDVNITEEYTIKSVTAPARLTIHSQRTGIEADIRRVMLEQYTAGKLSQMVTDDLKRIYPEVYKTYDVIINDDQEKNTNSITYQYMVDGMWQNRSNILEQSVGDFWVFKFEPASLYSQMNFSRCTPRKYEKAQNYPSTFKYTVKFNLPEEILIQDNHYSLSNTAFDFEETIEQTSSKSFVITYGYNTKMPIIPPEIFQKVCEDQVKIAQRASTSIYLPKHQK